MRQKRYPLLLDTEYPPEARVLSAISKVADGSQAGFIRSIIYIGHIEIEKDEQERKMAAAQAEKLTVTGGDRNDG